MMDVRDAEEMIVDEGAWIYLIGTEADPKGGEALHERLAEACEASGWPVVSKRAAGGERSDDPGRLFEEISHAVEHADCVVALLGGSTDMADAELALAYSHRRPIVGMRVPGEEDHLASRVETMLGGYERARVITCDNVAECGAELATAFDDPEFAATIRRAAGEHVAGI